MFKPTTYSTSTSHSAERSIANNHSSREPSGNGTTLHQIYCQLAQLRSSDLN
ncbi:hypothetical protein DPMN_101628 [Dreissena polymorpha]|uniref:Uncharacterized protein n=1 Tax=Dreissena polymorpha TaxID=45954 RepID=A0A9D4LHV9_DREPO|nr:hypothetical protein DPMN_101628 [Dreissena polymorpha]